MSIVSTWDSSICAAYRHLHHHRSEYPQQQSGWNIFICEQIGQSHKFNIPYQQFTIYMNERTPALLSLVNINRFTICSNTFGITFIFSTSINRAIQTLGTCTCLRCSRDNQVPALLFPSRYAQSFHARF